MPIPSSRSANPGSAISFQALSASASSSSTACTSASFERNRLPSPAASRRLRLHGRAELCEQLIEPGQRHQGDQRVMPPCLLEQFRQVVDRIGRHQQWTTLAGDFFGHVIQHRLARGELVRVKPFHPDRMHQQKQRRSLGQQRSDPRRHDRRLTARRLAGCEHGQSTFGLLDPVADLPLAGQHRGPFGRDAGRVVGLFDRLLLGRAFLVDRLGLLGRIPLDVHREGGAAGTDHIAAAEDRFLSDPLLVDIRSITAAGVFDGASVGIGFDLAMDAGHFGIVFADEFRPLAAADLQLPVRAQQYFAASLRSVGDLKNDAHRRCSSGRRLSRHGFSADVNEPSTPQSEVGHAVHDAIIRRSCYA